MTQVPLKVIAKELKLSCAYLEPEELQLWAVEQTGTKYDDLKTCN
jgi:hypothetical protein